MVTEYRRFYRGRVPALAAAPFNVGGTLADPQLTLFGPNSSTRVAATNDNWAAVDAATFAAVGAFALPAGSRDAAIVARLAPGSIVVMHDASGLGDFSRRQSVQAAARILAQAAQRGWRCVTVSELVAMPGARADGGGVAV